ncbi:MAG: hypothetical protein AAFV53_41645 [Myxococcota bacterium]
MNGSPPLLLLGAPNVGLDTLAEALSHAPGVRIRGDWDLVAVLRGLWEATESAARRPAVPWRRPDAPEWLDGTLADYARLLVHLEGQSTTRFGVAHTALARHLLQVAKWLPPFQFVHLARDPMHAAISLSPDLSTAATAEAGLRWAKIWTNHVEPPTSVRLPAVRVESLDPGSLIGVSGVRWRPPALPQLPPAAAEGFACHPTAPTLMSAFGYTPPAVGALSETVPGLIVARAEGDPTQAQRRLESGLRRSSDGRLWNALGELHRRQGAESEACRCFTVSIHSPNTPTAAWTNLLSMPHREESLDIIGSARQNPQIEIRAAAARWMVARGMDQESAEVLANVHGYRWYVAPNAASAHTR